VTPTEDLVRKALQILRHAAFLLLVAACAVLVALNVEAWRGGLVEDETPAPPRAAARAAGTTDAGSSQEQERQPAATETTTATQPPASASAGETEDALRAAAVAGESSETAAGDVQVTVRATDGPCWLQARAGSANGKVIYEGTLAPGRELTLSRDRVWLRLGAPANVKLTLNGRAVREVSATATDLIATPGGVRAAPSGGA
jgi:hypothetical protein